MKIKSNILILILSFFFLGCAPIQKNNKINNPPVKSFVKVFNTIKIFSCTDKTDKNCPRGTRMISGSGMAVFIDHENMTVLTAGHVCDVRVTSAIDRYSQTIEIMDHNAKIHQAWPILISHNNQKGDIDACVLWVPTLEVEKIKISKTKPKIGQDLYYIGAPGGIYHPPTVPIFKGVYSGVVDMSTSILTSPAWSGASGSAVLNYRNEIVGILWGVNSRVNNISTISNYQSFLLFIKKAKKHTPKNTN